MGARTNYTIITTENPEQNINVYAHWDGDSAVQILQYSLEKALPRIKSGDMSYGTRILIDQLTADGRDSETGYGIYIGSEITHEEQYDTKEIDLLQHQVRIGQMTMTFDEFMKVGVL